MLNPNEKRFIETLTGRLARLIAQSENPHQEMENTSLRLLEHDLMNWTPGPETTPMQFALTAIEENPLMPDHLRTLEHELRPELMESVDELISAILPAAGNLE
jgi:hypothetical protein